MKSSTRILTFIALSLLAIASVFAGGTSSGRAASNTFPSSFFAPYSPVEGTFSLQSVTQSTGQKFYVLTFILGAGCNAEWNGTVPFDQTSVFLPNLDSDIQFIRSQGGDIVISFGGAASPELAEVCPDARSLQAQYQAVIDKYHVTHLDFDIEGSGVADAKVDMRNTALASLQQANPGLVISYTLPSATTGLTQDGINLLNNAKSHGVNFSLVNLMAFDFGPPDPMMGQDAINAVNGFSQQLKQIFPAKSDSQLSSMTGLTLMIGQNDLAGEVLSESQAQQVLAFVSQKHIGFLSFWALTRDNGSCAGSAHAVEGCSGIAQGTFDFLNILKSFTAGGVVTPPPTVPPTASPPPPPTPSPTPVATPPPGVQPWQSNFHHYNVGDLVSFMGHTYQCRQAHNSQDDFNPVAAPALWLLIS